MTVRTRDFLLFLGIALAMGLAACSSAAPVANALPVPSVGSASVVQPTSAEARPTALEADQPTQVSTAPPVREDQYATDPTTVDLASGRPTLVKFFAFW